jgi:hypothetical protein
MRKWSRPQNSTCLGEKARNPSLLPLEEDPLKEKEQIREIFHELFSSQKLAVLGTHQSGQPYGSLVAFAATPDFKKLIFATTGRPASLPTSKPTQGFPWCWTTDPTSGRV